MNCVPEFETMVSAVFIGYLLWVSWQDYKSMQVIRYSHGMGLFAVILKIISQVFLQGMKKETIYEHLFASLLAVIVLLCIQIAACLLHLYGTADGMVFFLCGLFLLVQEGTEQYMLSFLWMTALSGGMLLVVQVLKGNIKGVALKHPVPYIPYISFAFILTKVVL